MSNINCGVDIGYGSTKMAFPGKGRGDIKTASFPSFAPVITDEGVHIEENFDNRRILAVDGTEGRRHLVGVDVMLGMEKGDGRVISAEFVDSSEYVALLKGALCQIRQPEIETLCMGLPIATLNSKRGKVIALAKGAHKLPIGDVLVKNVVVVAQPTGGLFDVASKVGQVGGIESLQSGLKLIIDPGHFTLDWVVADGIKGIEARSGSVLDAGMGAVLSSVMTSIVTTVEKRDGKRPAVTEHMLLKLDEAIRTGSGFYVNGQLVDPMPHLNACRKLIINALDKLEAGANSISDIQAVILVGGGAHIYKRHVEERFSKHSIHMSLDPAYANARGFLTLAEMATKRGLVHRSNAV